MPTTPNRGYPYPLSTDAATVPAHLGALLAPIDADVQTAFDEISAKVGLEQDGTAPAALLAEIRAEAASAASSATTGLASEAYVDEAVDGIEPLPAGDIPIFATLAEAQAWELANPGRTALTIEAQEPDDVAPVPGTLAVATSDVSAQLTVSGASDNQAVTGYAFKRGAGSWTSWQSGNTHTMAGLSPSTSYTFQHKVRDFAGNESLGTAVTTSTSATPPKSPEDVGSLLASWDMGSAVSSSGTITEVPDSVGGKTLVAATAGPTLTTSGGKTFAQFSAAGSTRLRWTGGWGVALPTTICAIMRRGGAAGMAVAASGQEIEVSGTGIMARSGSAVTSAIATGSTDLVLVTIAFTAAGITTRVGAATQTTASVPAEIGSNLALGARPSSTGSLFTDSTIGRVWVHGKVISQAEHDSLTDWARANWGTL